MSDNFHLFVVSHLTYVQISYKSKSVAYIPSLSATIKDTLNLMFKILPRSKRFSLVILINQVLLIERFFQRQVRVRSILPSQLISVVIYLA